MPSPEDCLTAASREVITKDLNIQAEFQGRQRNPVSVYKVPLLMLGTDLAAYFEEYGDILGASLDSLNIMLDRETVRSISNCWR